MHQSLRHSLGVWTFIALACVSQCPSINSQSRPIPEPGTLVIIVPTRDGIVIGADRRTNDEVRGDVDKTIKIRPIGKFTVVAATGSPPWADRATLKIIYEA